MSTMYQSGNDIRFFALSGETPTIAKNATVVWKTNEVEKNSVSGQPKNHNVTVTITQYEHDEYLDKFLDTYVQEGTATEATTKTREDGSQWSSASSGSAPNLYCVLHLGISNNRRKRIQGPVIVTANSGSIETAGGDLTTITLEITFVKATVAITLPDIDTANVSGDTFYPTEYVTLPDSGSTQMPPYESHAVGTSAKYVYITKGSKSY